MDLEDIRCPYCRSKRIECNEEYRFCCIFEHGEKTLDELPTIIVRESLLTLKIPFTCRDCGKYFYLVYKPVEIRV